MIGGILDVMPRAILEFHGFRASETAKLALHFTIGADSVQVLIDITKPYIWNGTAIWTAHGTIGAVRAMLEVSSASHATVVTDLTLVVAILTLLSHVFREVTSWE